MKYNIVILGDYNVGKTSIINRIVHDSFDNTSYPTIGTCFFSKIIHNKNINEPVKFSIWDTAGQERFRSFITFYLKNAHIIFLCYDITNINSFNNLKIWFNIINKYVYNDFFIGVLIGTKNDLEHKRIISYNEGHNYANKINFFFYETSSKLNNNIDTLFEFTIDTFFNKNKNLIYENNNKEKLELKNINNINKKNKYFYCNIL